MILDLPKIGQVRFDDNLTQDQLSDQLDALSKKYNFELPKGEFTTGEVLKRGVMRGAKQLGSTLTDVIPAMGASALGFNDYAKQQMQEAQDTQNEINKYYSPQYGSLKDVKGISDIPKFVLENVAEQVPNIATSLIPGGIGAAVGRRLGVAAAGRAAMPLIESGATPAELAHVAATKGAEYAARGQNAGIFLGSYAQNAPEVFQNIYDKTGELAPGAAALFGAGAAALDSVLPAHLMKNLTGPMKMGIVEKVLEKSGMDKGLLRSVASNMLAAAGEEGITEGMQEAISIAAENFVGKNPQIFGSPEWNRIMESSVRGAVGGGAFGATTGAIERGRAGRERAQQYEQALQKRAGRQLTAEANRQSANIDQFNNEQQQMQLPGMEMGPYTTLLPEGQFAKPPKVVEPKEPKGVQGSLFDEQGAPTKQAEMTVAKADKAAANRERLEQQRQAAATKEAAAKLKAAIAEIAPTKIDLLSLARQPSPLAQTIAQQRAENENLAAKRGPKPVLPTQQQVAPAAPTVAPQQAAPTAPVQEQPAPPQAAPVEQQAAAPVDQTTAVASEPTVVQKPTQLTPQQLPTTIDDNTFKGLGIGRTATFIRNKLIHGKDISNPADAAEVKRVLEAYAEKTTSTKARENVEAFLGRPEFQGVEDATRPDTTTTGTSNEVVSEPAGGAAGTVEPTERDGNVPAEQNAPSVNAGEVRKPAPVEKQENVHEVLETLGGHEGYLKTVAEAANVEGTHYRLTQHYTNTDGTPNPIVNDVKVTRLPDGKMVVDDGINPPSAYTPKGAKETTNEEAVKRKILSLSERENKIEGKHYTLTKLKEKHAGKVEQPAPVEKQPTKSKKEKAKKGAVEANKEQEDFIEENDKRVDSILTSRIHEAAQEKGIDSKFLEIGSHRGTATHKVLRLPALINEYRHLLQLDKEISTKEDAAQKIKNKQLLERLHHEITTGSPEGAQILAHLDTLSPSKRAEFLSNVTKLGNQEFESTVQQKVAEAAARKKAYEDSIPPEPKETNRKGPGFNSADRFKEALTHIKNNYLTKKDTPGFIALLNKGQILEAINYAMDKLPEAFKRQFKNEMQIILGKDTFYGPAYKGKNLDAAGIDLVKKGNVNNILDHLIKTIDNNEIKQVLRRFKALGLNPKIVIGEVGFGKAGSYDPATNTITLDPEHGLNEHTAIHEITHAAISHVLNNRNHPLTKQFLKFFDQIQNQLGAAYGAQDLQEFASELVGNPNFQAVLKTIKAPKSGNLFERIMQSIAEFFGFRKGQSAYNAGLKFINDAIDVSRDVEATPSEKMFMSTGQAVNDAFRTVGEIGKNMPNLTREAVDKARNTFSNIADKNSPMYAGPSTTKLAFGLLRLDHLNTIYKKQLPSIQRLIDALEKRNGTQERRIKEINKNYKHFTDVFKKHKAAMERMNDMAYDARLAEVDILNPKFPTTKENASEFARLRTIYHALPKEVQDVYKTIRNSYEDSINEYEKILLANATPSLAARIKAEFQTKRRVPGYIPFLRRGDFWVEYADPTTGERAASAFESIRERDKFIKDVLKGAQHKSYQNLQNAQYQQGLVPPTSFLGQIMHGLQKNGASQEQLNNVYQSYLALFPAQSLVKQFMKSENVRGMERDIVRGYGDTMIKWARKLSDSAYSPEIDKAIDAIGAEASNTNTPAVYAAAQNVYDQRGFMHNPTYSDLVSGATTLSYMEYIAGNASSALVNVTSLPMMVWPILSGKYGFAGATSAMMNASKIAINGLDKNARYKNLYEALMDHGQLEHTMAREVLEGRRQSTSEFTGLKAKMLGALSIPFAASEKYNRAVTAVAAYDLAKQKGKSEAQAIREAIDTVKDAHTSGMSVTAPKWMQHPLGRVAFTFKSFAWNSAFVIGRAFHQAFKGETPVVRQAAMRQLIGTYGMGMAFAGAKGLPFYGAASTLASIINALFGDDDEPFDFNEEMRDFFGEFAYKGPVNYLTNLEISNRVGLATDLIYRDDPRSVADHGLTLTIIQQALGPAASYAVNAENAAKMMAEGHTERAFEALAPSFVRNGMKGFRYMTEGAQTLKGDPIESDINTYNGLMQIAGFAPADLSNMYEMSSARTQFQKEVLARKTKLLNLYDLARTAGDTDLMSSTQDKITSFNEAHPGERITSATLQKSETARKANEKNMIDGIVYNKKLLPEIREKFSED